METRAGMFYTIRYFLLPCDTRRIFLKGIGKILGLRRTVEWYKHQSQPVEA